MLASDLLLQLGYALLVGAVLVSRAVLTRLLVAAAASALLLRAALWTDDLTTAAWMAALIGACLILLVRDLYESRAARVTGEEKTLLNSLVSGLSVGRARHLIDQGMWLNGKEGDVLVTEGEPAGHLYYLAEGEARVLSMGRQVGVCRDGDLIGELTVLSGESASATVVLSGPARFWCAPAEALRPYLAAHEDVRRAIDQGFAAALKSKLRATNRTIAEASSAPEAKPPLSIS